MKQKEELVVLEAPESKLEIKLVYSTKKKLAVRHMGCKRCEMKDWKF